MNENLRELINSLNEKEQARVLGMAKNHTRQKTTKALKKIDMKFKCQLCGANNTQVHHTDYSKYYLVSFLCFNCHREHHRRKIDIPAPIDIRKFLPNEHSTEINLRQERKVHPNRTWLKKLRERLCLTHMEIGKKVGISGCYAEELERSCILPSDKVMDNFYECFNVRKEFFLEGHEDWLFEEYQRKLKMFKEKYKY